MTFGHKSLIACAALLLGIAPLQSQSQFGGDHAILGIATNPPVVSEGQAFELIVSGYNLSQYSKGSAHIEIEDNVIRVNVLGSNCWAAGNPPNPPNDRPSITTVPFSGLATGTYRIEADWMWDCFGQHAYMESDLVVYPNVNELKFHHESPADGETTSGVGLIRGWACYPAGNGRIGKVSYTIDRGVTRIPLPHGSVRPDTWNVCGYKRGDRVLSGYGGVVYWPAVTSAGDHTLHIYIDDVKVESLDFTVASPPPTDIPEDYGFRKGASGEYIVEGFLGTDETVVIRWSEADQNFVIVDYQ